MKKYLVVKELQTINAANLVAKFDDYDKADTFAKLSNEQGESNVRYWVYEQSK